MTHAGSLRSGAWIGVVPAEDIQIYEQAGYGSDSDSLGRWAMLTVDANYRFFGRWSAPIKDAISTCRTACGEYAWNTIDAARAALDLARRTGMPIVYTTSGLKDEFGGDRGDGAAWRHKNSRMDEFGDRAFDDTAIVDELRPREQDRVIRKDAPSAFFGTNLAELLDELAVDTIVCLGGVTSGCVRATAVDGFSYGYRVVVLEDACFDRSPFMHQVRLFDLQAKYASVVSVSAFAVMVGDDDDKR